MRALVTGSAGFVGRHMVAALQARGYSVMQWDLARRLDALSLFCRSEAVYDLTVHAAARSPHRAAIDADPGMHPYNAMLDAALFDWAIRTRQPRILYLSSCAVLDGPVDGYAETKLAGEWLAGHARAAGIQVTVVRPYSGYGEDQGEAWPFGAFVARARRREHPFTVWGDGSQVRDWIHVDDLVAGSLAVADAGVQEPVSICTGVGTSMLELARLVCDTAGYTPNIQTRPDLPSGSTHRVGDPTLLHTFYTPKIQVEDGIRRALKEHD